MTHPPVDSPDAELSRLLTEVAHAVNLQEGAAGVHRVLRAIQQLDPASTRAVSRRAELPLPLVAAVNNELRSRGLLTNQRPATLTERGLALLGDPLPDLSADVVCPQCGGHGLTAPPPLPPALADLVELVSQAPPVDLTLDQTHCTVETKLRRVLFLLRHGLLPGRDLLLVGDDDLIGLAVAAAGVALGRPLVERLAVVDVSAEVIEFTRRQLARLGTEAELVEHDLREPLPAQLRGGFDLAMTDPPYTPEGARLFLSRAVEALRPGPGRAIGFSFGPSGPEDALAVQRTVTELGLVVHAMYRDFNDYHGAGVIGGRSNLQHLTTTGRTAPVVVAEYAGPMYTADRRAADRGYQCQDCRARLVVGPGARFRTVAELKAAGCPTCGGRRMRPLSLVPSQATT